ncbi:MAG TPA: thiol-disulfide oxidoreductase DCC family protein [Chitinophagaceae bacterium]|nr:thiol-disulfide oxidoreductase DCC family protein [Chitinophagaceae bacterium]
MLKEKIILFDGVCNLCNKSVQFVIRRDKEKKFKFASLQSQFGQKVLEQFNLPKNKFNSFILLDSDRIYTRSTGALRMLSQLKGWKWAGYLNIIPSFIRDGVYNLVSKYRYNWFGKRDACMIPTPELKDRFID